MKKIIQTYLNSYKNICPELTDEELLFIKDEISVTNYKKKDFYLKKGKIQKGMSFIYSGLIRQYYIDLDGNEKTVNFFNENNYVTDYYAFLKQQPTHYYFQCLEPCVLVNLPFTVINQGYEKYKNYEKYGRLIAESILTARQLRLESFIFETATERYNHFLKQNPALYNRISLTHLSSYLGIQRQSLSRIRKKST